ncbi:hypothetical protein [Streptomyces sp. NPDC005374]
MAPHVPRPLQDPEIQGSDAPMNKDIPAAVTRPVHPVAGDVTTPTYGV